MPSESNVELVRRMCNAFARGDWDEATAPLHPEVEWDMSTYAAWPEPEVARGPAGVWEFFRRFLGAWSDYHAEFYDFLEVDGDVVVSVRDGGRGKGSGAVVEREWAQVWTVEDGAVVRFRPFETREEALAAVGEAN
jgi:ketosteroid isomerase-like protein